MDSGPIVPELMEMARFREFDEEVALQKALELFWERGYQASSLTDLLSATGLSRSSFYEAFGTKRDLLLAALSHYVDSAMCGLAAPLFQADASRLEIEAFVGNMIRQGLGKNAQRGCLVNNIMVELASHDEDVLAAVRNARQGLERALAQAVVRGQQDGSIESAESAASLARFLANSVSGLNMTAKSRPGKAVLEDIGRLVLSVLDKP